MRGLNMIEGCKSAHVFALNPMTGGGAAGGGGKDGFLHQLQEHLRVNSVRSRTHQRYQSVSHTNNGNSTTVVEALAAYGLPKANLIEPQIDPFLKFVDFVGVLADVYRRLENCPELERSEMYMEQCAIFRGFPDPKLFRRCLRSARQHVVDVHSKVVLAAWLRYERREDELMGVSALDCSGWSMECPKSSLVSGYNPESANDSCLCIRGREDEGGSDSDEECSTSLSYGRGVVVVDDDDDYDMWFCVGEDEVRCNRFKIASLSKPFKSMLYGNFVEAKKERIHFTHNGISAKAIRAAEVFSRIKSVDSFDPNVVLELLSFANRFCCDELKSACDVFLASLVDDIEIALQLIDYGLEETAYLLVAACLQVILREPSSSMQPNVLKHFCSSEAMQRLAQVEHASFLLYNFLSLIAMEENMKSNATVMLLERMGECATKNWQKQLAFHQLGCVMLERKEYKDAQKWFEAAFQAGHVYSLVGVARGKDKRGHKYKAFKLTNSLFSDYNPCGWMYQERSLYSSGREKMMDLNTATEMDPTLSYPYKYRAIALMEDEQIGAAISEVSKIIGFKVSPDCLELRAWFLISLRDYEGALTDVRALLTLDPQYMMFHGKLSGAQLVELLCAHVEQRDQADCWMQLYDRWSSVDDIGSLAVVHDMLAIELGKSLLRFRQSLILLR